MTGAEWIAAALVVALVAGAGVAVRRAGKGRP
jgi:hypothetical protein